MRPARAPQKAARRLPRERPAPASSRRRENSARRAVVGPGNECDWGRASENSWWIQYSARKFPFFGPDSRIARHDLRSYCLAASLAAQIVARITDRKSVVDGKTRD